MTAIASRSPTDILTPDSDEGRSMSTEKLWDYMEKVLMDYELDPPQKSAMGKLLHLSEETQRNVLWDVIILRPTHATSFITRLVAEELERVSTAARKRKAGRMTQLGEEMMSGKESKCQSKGKPITASLKVSPSTDEDYVQNNYMPID